MADYFATFITGCQEIIGKRLNAFANNQLQVRQLYDGLVVFQSSLSSNQLSELRLFNNVYTLLADGQGDPATLQLPAPRLHGTFLVRVSEQGQPAPVPNDLRDHIALQSGADFTAHRPDNEFLLLKRSDGHWFWGIMLPRAGFKQRRIEAGELSPQLAHILALVAGLDAKDAVLDPFAGYGGIVREALQGFHAKEVIAVEENEHLVPHLKSIPHLVALHGDARQLAHVQTRSIDRIITDPPWGEFATMPQPELHKLYVHAFFQMHRVLRTKGAVVMLAAVPFMAQAAAEGGFAITHQYPILVAGHKATIYKLRKLNQ
ncbi:MAG TPA: hypothetical protein VLG40_04530 [Candidatus Saccharimonas sp.]|nr:hypothetical protein [Candidatus Saccharimonas sp.]